MNVKFIVNTHGHHAHIGANKKVKEYIKKDLLIHKKDSEMLTSSRRNFSILSPPPHLTRIDLKMKDLPHTGLAKKRALSSSG